MLPLKLLLRRPQAQSLNFVRHKSLVRSTSTPSTLTPEGPIKDKNYWEEIRIPVPWGHVAGKAWGNNNGLPVLGIHGWQDNAGTFDTLAPLLLESLYFVTVDLPGHGLSSQLPPGRCYNFLEYLLTLRRIVQHLSWNRFSIIGHSLGAGLGAIYSGLYPKEIERLVLLDFMKLVTNAQDATYPRNLAEGFDSFLELEAKTLREETPTYTYEDAVSRLIRGTRNQLSEESARILMIRGARQVSPEDRWQYARDVLVNKFRVLRLTHDSALEIHKQIQCPILLLKAKGGLVMETKEVLDQCLRMYQDKPSFKMTETGQGHYFHLNDPLQPAALINTFFQDS